MLSKATPPQLEASKSPHTAQQSNTWPAARNPRDLHESLARLRRRAPLRLGDALTALGLIEPAEIEKARAASDEDPSALFGDILQRTAGTSDEAVRAGLAFQLGIPAVDLHHWPLDTNVLAELPAPSARYYRAVPILAEDNVLYVAMSNIVKQDALDAMHLATSRSVHPVYASETDIEWALNQYYVADTPAEVSDEDLERNRDLYVDDDADSNHETPAESDNVIVRLADQIIAEAYRERSSDIHIEPAPERGDTIVRVRIDGRMYVRRSIPWVYRDALVSRFKVMANLNVAEHRIPQDGKILFRKTGAPPIELRVAVLPTVGGLEDIVLRILDSSAALPLEMLGLGSSDHGRLTNLIERPYGILLVCGPTGSGKTTTLHAVLHRLNDGTRKIWTVENPVEITQQGLRQVEVNPRTGLTFSGALRAFLRADPDVVMVGEVRDTETAKTALEASLTGHLVLSTLHTNNAPESIVRLLEMGMNPFNFADSLLGILAQRLVPSLCKTCRHAITATDEMLEVLAREYAIEGSKDQDLHELISAWKTNYGEGGRLRLYQARGCADCMGTGYKGRIGIFELMPASTAIKRLIINRAPATELFEAALAEGMRTLKQDGIVKVLTGATELARVLAVAQR